MCQPALTCETYFQRMVESSGADQIGNGQPTLPIMKLYLASLVGIKQMSISQGSAIILFQLLTCVLCRCKQTVMLH